MVSNTSLIREFVRYAIVELLGLGTIGLLGAVSPYTYFAVAIILAVALFAFDRRATLTKTLQQPERAKALDAGDKSLMWWISAVPISLIMLGIIGTAYGDYKRYFYPTWPPPFPLKPADPESFDMDSLLTFEFPNAVSIGTDVEVRGTAAKTILKFQTRQDLSARAEFYLAYIPKSEATYELCQLILAEYKELRNSSRAGKSYQRKFGRDYPVVNEDLPFTGTIYIYHESPLTEDQRRQLWQQFKEKGVTVFFKGPDHLAERRKHYPLRQK
jgi:hypothetical protein